MAVQRLKFRNFSGGLSDDTKIGPANSASELQAADFRTSPALISFLRQPQQENDITLQSAIFDACNDDQGNIYFAADQYVYQRAPSTKGSGAAYTEIIDTGDSIRDLFFRADLRALFLIGSHGISEYSPVGVGFSPVLSADKYGDYDMVTVTATGGEYPVPAVLTESELLSFECTGEPVQDIFVRCVTKAVGTWDLDWELHDAANTVLQTGTVASTDITAGEEIDFAMAERLAIGSTYHIHVFSATPGTTLQTDATNTFPVASIRVRARRLVDSDATTGYGHRTIAISNFHLICNERYVAKWEILSTADNSMDGYEPHRLTFPSNYRSIGFATYSEYTAIACAIDNRADTTETGTSLGTIFFWDNTSSTYNFALDVPFGAPNSLFAHDNALLFECKGIWYRWAGNEFTTVFQFPGTDSFLKGDDDDAPSADFILRAPRIGMAVLDGLVEIAFPYQTSNQLTEYAVYSFGHNKSSLPMSVGKDYLLSTGHTSVQFDNETPFTGYTMLKKFGESLFICWQDLIGTDFTYGVDVLNRLSPYSRGLRWRSLWFDNDDPDIEKTPLALKVTFRPLPADTTVTPYILLDRDETPVYVNDVNGEPIKAGEGEMDVVIPLDAQNGFYEIMVGFDVVGAGVDQVYITSGTFKFDDNRNNTQATESRRGASA
jgi:hypothetical protein